MKKIISVLAMLVLSLGMVSATTEIWTSVSNTGTTTYTESFSHGGTNWQRTGDVETGSWYVEQPSPVYHVNVDETITNTGSINIEKYTKASDEWDSQEIKYVWGEGETTIDKQISWTTNTRSVGEDGLLAYPTNMQIDVEMITPFGYKQDTLSAVTNMPPAQDWKHFYEHITTNEAFDFRERIGVNKDLLTGIPMP